MKEEGRGEEQGGSGGEEGGKGREPRLWYGTCRYAWVGNKEAAVGMREAVLRKRAHRGWERKARVGIRGRSGVSNWTMEEGREG